MYYSRKVSGCLLDRKFHTLLLLFCLQVESINIHEINEGELKSLLDEAYNFRSPKDREGKSPLFQVSYVHYYQFHERTNSENN